MLCSIKSPAHYRYVVRMWVAAAFCILFAFASAFAFRFGHVHGVLAYAMAVLPSIPIVAALIWTGMYLDEEKDEFQRNLLIQCLLAGMGATLALTTIWGYLENFGQAPHMPLTFVYAIFWVATAVSNPVIRLRYR
jgi:hypothetical protein